jgi:hypothetical protein
MARSRKVRNSSTLRLLVPYHQHLYLELIPIPLGPRYEQVIKDSLGLAAYDALPIAHRPDNRSLDRNLLAVLAGLARRVPDVEAFRERLIRARENRPAPDGFDMQNNSIQEHDVVVALAALDQEELEPKRSLKSADAEESSLGQSNDEGSRRKKEPLTTHLSSGLTSTGSVRQRKKPRRSVEASNPSLQEHRLSRGSGHEVPSSNNDMSSQTKTSSIRKRKAALRSSSPKMEGVIYTQQEHNAFFKENMPKGQHYKQANPRFIPDVLAVDDFAALPYPIEVPHPTAKNSYCEIKDAEEFKEHLDWIRDLKKRSPAKKIYGASSMTPTPMNKTQFHQQATESEVKVAETEGLPTMSTTRSRSLLVPVKQILSEEGELLNLRPQLPSTNPHHDVLNLMINLSVERFQGGLSPVNEEARRRARKSNVAGREARAQVLMHSFVRHLEVAVMRYKDGLKDLDLIPSGVDSADLSLEGKSASAGDPAPVENDDDEEEQDVEVEDNEVEEANDNQPMEDMQPDLRTHNPGVNPPSKIPVSSSLSSLPPSPEPSAKRARINHFADWDEVSE